VVFADFTDDTLKVMGVGNDHDGTPIESVIERTNIRLGNPNRRKYIRRVFPRFYGADGNDVLIQIGTQQTPTSGVEWGAEQTFRIGEDRHVSVDAAGFLVAFRMRTVGAGIWRLSQFELEFEWAGLY
jgi:hypothetical protein